MRTCADVFHTTAADALGLTRSHGSGAVITSRDLFLTYLILKITSFDGILHFTRSLQTNDLD